MKKLLLIFALLLNHIPLHTIDPVSTYIVIGTCGLLLNTSSEIRGFVNPKTYDFANMKSTVYDFMQNTIIPNKKYIASVAISSLFLLGMHIDSDRKIEFLNFIEEQNRQWRDCWKKNNLQ